MMKLDLPHKADPFRILCLGAHSDDIEIGCGGSLLRILRMFPQSELHWVVFSALGPRGQEAVQSAELFAGKHEKKVVLKQFRDGFLPQSWAEVKECFEQLKSEVNPDLIFTHWQGDAHQDHRVVSELTWNTFRNHLILEYEIPKYDGDMGRPNVFVSLDEADYKKKVDFLFEAFASQRQKPWFDQQLFLGLMRIRGMEANSPSGYAEGFHSRKIVVA